MSTDTVELRSRTMLLGESFDVETALMLRRIVRQYRAERMELDAAIAEISRSSLSDKEARMAVISWAKEDLDAALEQATKASKSAVAQVVAGRIAEERGDLDAALKYYKKAGSLAPSSPPAVLSGLDILRKQGKVEDALEMVDKLRQEFSDRPMFHYEEGRCLEMIGEYQEALECYRNALELDDQYPEALFHAGRLCDQRGLDDEARDFYSRIGPNSPVCFVNACLNLTLLYEDAGDYDSAKSCCRAVLKVDPNNQRAKLFLEQSMSSTSMYYSPEETKQSERLEAVLRVPVSDFELSVRSRNCLANMNINSLGDLVKKTESEMLAYKNFGETSLREIKEMLSSRNLRLGMMREDAATRAAMERAKSSASQELLNRPISELELGVRARKCMDSLGVVTIADLANMTEADLATAKNFGRVSLNEIKKKMTEHGISLRDAK